MSAIEKIRARLTSYPAVAYAVEEDTLSIRPATPDGFAVSLTEAGGEYVVSYEGWHEHFRSEDEALDCFGFGLSDRCRLRIDYRGDQPCRWTVEKRTDSGWRGESSTGLVFTPLWRRRRTEYRQNTLLSAAEPGAAGGVRPGIAPG